MATVIVDRLLCEVEYTNIARGTLDGQLVGPRSSHRTVTADPCPPMMTTTTTATASMVGSGGVTNLYQVFCKQ